MQTCDRTPARVAALALVLLFLSGCGTPSSAQIKATAEIDGCWPGNGPTPAPVTVTPSGHPSATPLVATTPVQGAPTLTALPTSTPYPRCTPVPGAATLIPYSTPRPTTPPFPTRAPGLPVPHSGLVTVLAEAGWLYHIDLAAHPIDGWVAAAGLYLSENADPSRVFARVLNPTTGRWGDTVQVSDDASAPGKYFRTIQVAVDASGVISIAWGMSDAESACWAVLSRDQGLTWSAPTQIAVGCQAVADLATTLDGHLVALLVMGGERVSYPAIVERLPGGAWRAPQPFAGIGVPYYSEGVAFISSDGPDALLGALLFAQDSAGLPIAYTFLKHAAEPTWRLGSFRLARADGRTLGLRMWHPRAATFPPLGVVITVADAEQGSLYALTSSDGGTTWMPLELVSEGAGQQRLFIAPAYDAAARRMLALWTCCGEDTNAQQHYASWSIPASGLWTTILDSRQQPIPLVLGARSPGETVVAQALNTTSGFVGWIEGQQRLLVRSFDVDQLIPPDHYPLPYSQTSQGVAP